MSQLGSILKNTHKRTQTVWQTRTGNQLFFSEVKIFRSQNVCFNSASGTSFLGAQTCRTLKSKAEIFQAICLWISLFKYITSKKKTCSRCFSVVGFLFPSKFQKFLSKFLSHIHMKENENHN